MTITRTFIGILIIILGISYSYSLWFTDTVDVASGVPALLVIWISSAIGLATIFWAYTIKKLGFLIPLTGAILFHILMDTCMRLHKESMLLNQGLTTYAIVSFRDRVARSKTTSEEIRYTYYINSKPYFKYDENNKFILKNDVQIGDTLIIKYLADRPNWHSIAGVKKNNR